MHHWRHLRILMVMIGAPACAGHGTAAAPVPSRPVRPGITVLLEDSLALVRGKRIGLLTNQTGVDANGVSDIELLRDARARAAGVTLVRLFSPEHGIRGTEDREHLESGIDARSGLMVHSLYTVTTIAPPDSLLVDLDAIVYDLQDIGTRTWTYVGAMVYAMRAAARRHLPIIVLDRPDPITGDHVDGPMLDTALSNAEEHTSQRPGKAYALYPFPLRHGMTMGELALFYNSVLGINAQLHVVPVTGWRRSMWFDQTGLPWVRPSPNLPTLASALVYPSLVAFEGTNLSVGRGTPDAFQHIGAPWLDADATIKLLKDRELHGVKFSREDFTPDHPTDGKYAGQRIQGIKIKVSARNAMQPSRVGATLLWAINKTSGAGLKINDRTFDLRFGAARVREALLRGDDPDEVIDREYKAAFDFREQTRRFLLYN